MPGPRFCLVTATVLALITCVLEAQERRVIITEPDDAELRRLSLQLDVSQDQIGEFRKLLKRATHLAAELEDAEFLQLSLDHLAKSWIALDRSKAASSLRNFITRLRTIAADRAFAGHFQKATLKARSLAQLLEIVDKAGAASLMSNWPEAPDSRIQASDAEWVEQEQRRTFLEKMRRDPLQALAQLDQVEREGPNLSARSRLITSLTEAGNQEEARFLLDETLDLARVLPPDASSFSELRTLLSVVVNSEPQAINEVLGILASHASKAIPGEISSFQLGNQTAELSEIELGILGTLSWMAQFRPAHAAEALRFFPQLHQKLQPLGGLDGWTSFERQGRLEGSERVFADVQNQLTEAILEEENSIAKYVDQAGEPTEKFRHLTNLAGNLYGHARFDPKMARKALDAALQVAQEMDDPLTRLRNLRRLALYYQSREGEFPGELVELFFQTAEESKAQAGEGDGVSSESEASPPTSMEVDSLTSYFYSHWILTDQEGALRHLTARHDDPFQVKAMTLALLNLTLNLWRPHRW